MTHMKTTSLAFALTFLFASACATKSHEATPDGGAQEVLAREHDDFAKAVDAVRKKCGLALSMGRYAEGTARIWKGKLVGMIKYKDTSVNLQASYVKEGGTWVCKDADSLLVFDDAGVVTTTPCAVTAEVCGH